MNIKIKNRLPSKICCAFKRKRGGRGNKRGKRPRQARESRLGVHLLTKGKLAWCP
jgi:hypothetical protein